jgi:hypothetical protein
MTKEWLLKAAGFDNDDQNEAIPFLNLVSVPFSHE